ncbi:TonB-dependent receptor [Mucilaginibacter limnophilus]|uniref:TonB-dependent receptor n=1 Tax=Mucilaginibacter limnophilus TaxID=1932778 RepID=A0A437MQS6_9SPHI|nr:TonB-dependent receptor [Mucilaginibacter limnophilus]RVU00005.1 TonB-dependent receptor [Mucilaginibacter limnophilus]
MKLMIRLITVVIALTAFTSAHAQKQKLLIKGRVTDTAGKAIDYATVALFNAADSTIAGNTVTGNDGTFELSNSLKVGRYKIIIAQMGLTSLIKYVTLSKEAPVADLGTMKMETNVKELKEVNVTAEAAPISIKKDTVEYNAGSFKTQPNDNVEGLLKKLPGVDVDADGKIKAGGKDVKKILVDGREFFGGDPKAVTKNLPADAIKKVQLIDDKTEKTKNTGIDDGQRDKVINVTLKDDKKKGWFGNITTTGGTDERYLGQFNLNRFDNKKQIALISLTNNVNEVGFTYEDLNAFTGGNVWDAFSSGGGGNFISINSSGRANINGTFSGVDNGLINNHNVGLNYSDILGKKEQFKFNVSALGLISSNKLIQNTNIEDSPNDLFTSQFSRGNNSNNTYRFNFNFDYKPDTLTNIRFKPNFSLNYRKNESTSGSGTSRLSTDTAVNTIDQFLTGNTFSPSYGGSLGINRKFTGGNGSINWFTNGNYSSTDYDYTNIYKAVYFSGLGNNQNQQASQGANATFINSTLSYIRPLSKAKKIDLTLSQGMDYRKQLSDQVTYDYNGVTGKYELINSLLSGDIDNRNWRYTTTAGIAKNSERFNININMAVAALGLSGDFTSNGQYNSVKRDAFALVPNASFSYRKKNGHNIYFNVGTDVNLPSATDLQPVFNNTNPLYIRQGNPDLVMSRSLNTSLSYNFFDMKNNTYISFYGSFNPTWNGFSTESSVDTNGITTSRPINTDGNFSSWFGANYGKPTKIKGLRYSLNLNGGVNRNVNIINGNQNAVLRFSPSLGVGGSFDRDNFNIDLRTYSSYNKATNSYQHTADQRYFSFYNTLKAGVKPGKNWRIYSDVTQRLYRSQETSANTSFYIWNAGIERYLLPKQNLTLSVNAFDLLNQNAGVQWQQTPTGQLINTESNTIRRYFYVRLIYKITRVGEQKNTPGLIIMR